MTAVTRMERPHERVLALAPPPPRTWPADARRPPRTRPLTLRRPRLVQPLCDADAPAVVVLVAPAGYGKTTVLADWAERDRRPFAWITLQPRHDDATELLAAVADAVDRVHTPGTDTPFVLVLDDVHTVRRPLARSVLSSLADDLPAGASLALAGREEPPVALPRLRAERNVTELRRSDLAVTRAEASTFLRLSGMEVERAAVDVLLRRTEGWPAALSLAPLSLGNGPSDGAVARFGGADRLVADYLREEVMAPLPADDQDFLLRSSVLETLTAPLCDAVLERADSGATLSRLARDGLLLELDRTEDRYRHQRLLGEMLGAELRRAQPGRIGGLHARAGTWHRRMGDPERALRHSLSAGEAAAATDLVWKSLYPFVTHGRADVLQRWLAWFPVSDGAPSAKLALAAATTHLARGEGDLARHWTAVAAASPAGRPGGPAEGMVAALRAAVAPRGLRRMSEDAASACRLASEKSSWRSLCCLLRGVVHQVLGDDDEAKRRLEESARLAAVTAPSVHALALAQLSVLAIDRADWEEAAVLITRARAQVDRHGLEEDPPMALVFAVSAAVRTHRGRIDDARSDFEAAVDLHAGLTDFPPWYEVELRLVLARTALRHSDTTHARRLLAEATRLAPALEGAPVPERWLEDTRAHLADFTTRAAARPSLTAAELRILLFLPTHLSFREIAERTYVSANTVKTQANAVYRKLGVSCRSDAVDCAREAGLLDA
jgi:LuxR family maltose regulon positive regulatory protein